MKPVTDPSILSQLESTQKPVTDPALLAQLEGTEQKKNPSLMDVVTGPATMGEWAQGRVNAVKSLAEPSTWQNLGKGLTQPLQPIPSLKNIPFNSQTPEGIQAMNLALSVMPVSGISKLENQSILPPNVSSQEAIKQAGLVQAGGLGYKVPRSTINPSSLGVNIGERFGGKDAIRTVAENANQEVTNKIAQQALSETPIGKAMGLASNTPINPDTINAIRTTANQAYDAVRNIGTIKPSKEYFQGLDDIAGKYTRAGQSFPNAAKNEVQDLVNNLKVKQFDSGSALDMINILRESAKKAFRDGDSGLGLANRKAAEEIENAIDSHLASSGAPSNIIGSFRGARQSLAVLHSIEDALNAGSGNIEAPALSAMLNKGVPLQGGLKKIAEFASANPLISRPPRGAPASGGSLEPLAYSAFGHVMSPTNSATGFMAGGIPIIAKPLIRPLMVTTPKAASMAGNMASQKSQILARLLASLQSGNTENDQLVKALRTNNGP
jgi:hypothetical protein